MPPGQPLLRVSDLTLKFGGVTALAHVDMSVESGRIHAIIGPNGAGKSSLLNCMSGLYRPTSGSVALRYVADDVGQAGRTWLEPITVLGALAVSTERIGMIATASSTYAEPFNLARMYASLDHMSRGRAAWNIVTTWSVLSAC